LEESVKIFLDEQDEKIRTPDKKIKRRYETLFLTPNIQAR
jgi:hypothetical protein